MSRVIDFTGERFERLAAWARYLHWADLHRRRFHEFLSESEPVEDDPASREQYVALEAAWYATLWVVVEGWREVPLADPGVEEVLDSAPRYQEQLRRFRNGVFHFQPKLLNPRLTDFSGRGPFLWTYLLHSEFCRFYWLLFDNLPPGLDSEIKESVFAITGWSPDDVHDARIAAVEGIVGSAHDELIRAGDFTSPEAKALLEAADNAAGVVQEARAGFTRWRSELLDEIRHESV
ncbi:MAG: hypothetical protein JXB46_08990 [Candidatus Eisenbacteria bacterium]|nr:hypothetical protein [Candidatus Eisenbacteria bacterium]